MSHRRSAAAAALAALVLTTGGCAEEAGTAPEDAAPAATDMASSPPASSPPASSPPPSSAPASSKAVVAHAKAYAMLVRHPAYIKVQTGQPESLPAFVDEVTRGKLSATSNGKVWTFTDVAGDCATTLSTDDTGGEIYGTTCDGAAVDEEFQDALAEALAP